MRPIDLRSWLALCAVVAAAACTAKSDTQSDTAIVTGDTSMAAPATATTTPAASTTSSSTAAIVPININTATDAQILAIPGMGPRMLREFKEYRPYKAIDQFRREIGKYVDTKEVARLERYVTVD